MESRHSGCWRSETRRSNILDRLFVTPLYIDTYQNDATITHQDASTTTPDEATMSRDTTSTEESDDGLFQSNPQPPRRWACCGGGVVAYRTSGGTFVYGAVTGPMGRRSRRNRWEYRQYDSTAQHVEVGPSVRPGTTTQPIPPVTTDRGGQRGGRCRVGGTEPNECTQPSSGPRRRCP